MPRAATISSPANPLVKEIRRAVERRSLTAQGWCVAETFHLLEEALRDAEVRHVFASESVSAEVETRLREHPEIPLALLPDRLFQTLSATETSQGVLALVSPRVWNREDLALGPAPLIVVLDGVRDPGNAGAMVRAAEAFGASGVVFLKGSVSPYNPKTLRASAGSLFRVPFFTCETFDFPGLASYAAVPAHTPSARSLSAVDLTQGCALVIGSEAHGVSPALRAASIELCIPTAGVESLNAAMAAAVLLYEAARQRSLPR
jgi:TrmH family RNA methyltransferase